MKDTGHRIMILLDFDGTLAPITSTPDQTEIPKATVHVLLRLIQSTYSILGVVSGRTLPDLQRKLGPVAPPLLAANHGLEWVINGKSFHVHVPLRIQRHLAAYRRKFTDDMMRFPHLMLEDKGVSFAVHYRHVPNPYLTEFMRDWNKSVVPALPDDLSILSNTNVFEIRPHVAWNKGDIVDLMLRKMKIPDRHLIYIGDDTTDESVFMKFSDALTVRVGYKTGSHARYYIRNVAGVFQFLMTLTDMLS